GSAEDVTVDLHPLAQVDDIGESPGNDERQGDAVPSERDGVGQDGGRRGHAPRAREEEEHDPREHPVAALDEPAVEGDGGERGEGEARVVVDEGGGEDAPDLLAPGPRDDYELDDGVVEEPGPPEEAADEAEDDEE